MKVAFISGPYRAKTEWGVKSNIENAEQVALKYWKQGYAVICPHKNRAFLGGTCDNNIWLEGSLEFLKRSDTIVFLSTWEDDQDSRYAHHLAVRLKKEIIYEKGNNKNN